MKRKYLLPGLALLLVWATPASAQDEHSPQDLVEFARKLRDKGYVDLAMEKFDEALRRNPPAALQHALQFELAKTRLMLARGLDPEERLEAVDKARTELEGFLKKYGNSPEAAAVRQDLKRITGEQALGLLSLALRLRGIEAQQQKAKEAEKYFRLNAAAIEASIKSLGVEEQRRQAWFDLAVNKMEQARCYVNVAKEETRYARAKIVGEARTIFEDLVKKDIGRIGLLSKAWLIKCCSEDEGSDPSVANKCYDELKNLTTKNAEEARRLARYFQMVRLPKIQSGPLATVSVLDKYKKVQFEAEAWLKSYPAHAKTPIGYGVRYELASALYHEARGTKDAQRQSALYARAQDILYALNQNDNDMIGKVTELRSNIARLHLTGKADASIGDLGTFDLCCLRAGIEYERVQNLGRQIEDARAEAAKRKRDMEELAAAKDAAAKQKLKDSEKAFREADKKAADLDKKLKEHMRGVIQSLSRALALADQRTPRYAVDNVRYDLLVAYSRMESQARTRTPYRTAIFGEAVAKANNPPSKHGALAMDLAIDACARIVAADPSAGNRQRLRDLALFAVSPEFARQWDKTDVVGLARYQLAMLDQNEATLLFAEAERNKGNPDMLQAARAKLQDAADHLSKLPRERPGDQTRYFFAHGRAVFLALEARDKIAFPKEKDFYRGLARKMIADLPPLAPGVEPTAVDMYFQAKMEEAKFLYADAAELLNQKKVPEALQTYQKMAVFLSGISRELAGPAVKIEDDRMKQLRYYVGTMEKYAMFGQADYWYKAGNYDKVLEPALTGKVVDFVKSKAAMNPEVRLKDFQITGQIVGLALRANVQQGKVEEAVKLMKILQNLKDVKDNSLVDTTAVLRGLVGELDAQIQEFQRKGDQRDKLERTQKNFTQFLDVMAKQADKNLDEKELFFLARCYDTLNQHDKAASLYGRYPRPPTLEVVKKDKEKFSDAEERELQSYCYAQVMLAKQLRLLKKPAEAKKILDAVAAYKNARQLTQVEREQIYLLEENGLYGTAITRWSNFMNSPAFKGGDLATDTEKKKIYFDAYYHLAYSWYKYSQSDKVKAAGKDGQFLVKAVDYIVRLENSQSPEGWQLVGHRFRELMQNERILNEAYMKQSNKQ